MHTNEDLKIVKDFYNLVLSGNVPEAMKLLHEDIKWVEPGAPQVPFGGIYTGHNGIGQMFLSEHKAVQLKNFTPKNYFLSENLVVVLGADSAEVPSTGKTYATDWTMFFTLDNQKIRSVQTYMDTNAIAQAFIKDN